MQKIPGFLQTTLKDVYFQDSDKVQVEAVSQ